MKLKTILIAFLLLAVLSAGVMDVSAQEDLPVVRAILFYSPTCPHCHQVITEDLPPLYDQYGDQLIILYIDVTTEGGNALFVNTLEELGFSLEEAGVPYMVVDQTRLVGSIEIPEKLPGIIEDGLAVGGIDWPPAPMLIKALTAEGFIDPETGAGITPTPALADGQESEGSEEQPTEALTEAASPPVPTETIAPVVEEDTAVSSSDDSNLSVIDSDLPVNDGGQDLDFGQFGERFSQDPVGNSIAVVMLLVMVGLVIWIGIQFMQAATPKLWPETILPVLLVLGLGIAIYLAVIEVSGNEAICGPVGDCNAVQQSQYSKLFGFLPVAVLGIIGYVLIGASWLVARRSSGSLQFYAKMGMFLFALFGLLFFIYLTFLEPFVIGATCAWCISSAVIMSLITIFTTRVALNAWAEMDFEFEDDEDV